MRASSKFSVAKAICSNGLVHVKCAYWVKYPMNPFIEFPKLVFRCPICGDVHHYNYSNDISDSPKLAHCYSDFWTADKCRKDSIELIFLAGLNNSMVLNKISHFGYFMLEPTDDFSSIGFLNKREKEKLIDLKLANGIINYNENLLMKKEKARQEAKESFEEVVKIFRLLDTLNSDSPEKLEEAIIKNFNS